MSEPVIEWRQTPDTSSVTTTAPEWGQKSGKALYLYFDESGNLDFKSSGTKYFVMTCIAVRRPFLAAHILDELKYNLIESGLDIEKLHACEDNEHVRKLVYAILSQLPDEYTAYAAYADKSTVPEEYRTPDAIYSKIFELIIGRVFEKEAYPSLEKIVAITDRLPQDAKKREVSRPLKKCMKTLFQNNGVPYSLMHHDSSSDMNLQAVDYFCWAAQRDLAQGKSWPMTRILNSFAEVGQITFS